MPEERERSALLGKETRDDVGEFGDARRSWLPEAVVASRILDRDDIKLGGQGDREGPVRRCPAAGMGKADDASTVGGPTEAPQPKRPYTGGVERVRSPYGAASSCAYAFEKRPDRYSPNTHGSYRGGLFSSQQTSSGSMTASGRGSKKNGVE